MMKKILFTLLLTLSCAVLAAQNVSVRAEIDSCQRFIGQQARIKLKVGVDAEKRALLPLFDKVVIS